MKTLLYIIIISILLVHLSFPQWEEQSSGTTQSLSCVSAVDDNVCWAGGSNTIIIKTTNGGTNWMTSFISVSQTSANDIYAFNDNRTQFIRWVLSSGATEIFETTNSGTNWNSIFFTSSTLECMRYISPDSGLIVGFNQSRTRLTIWKTTTGGQMWDSTGLSIAASNEEVFRHSLFMLGTKGWFITNKKRVLYTSDFGSNWVSQPLSSSNNILDGMVWFNTPTTGICGGIDVISSTTNSGTNWIPQTQAPGAYILLGGIIGRDIRFWVSFGTNISITTDRGSSWTVVYTASGVSHYNDLSVARNGTNVWGVRDGGHITKGINIVGISPISQNVPVNFSLKQNYPNPFNPSTHIRYDISQSSLVKLVVYDILGRQVSVLVNEQLKPGEYEAVWSADNMPSGVYFYRLTAGSFSETKKMMLVK